MGLKEIGFFFRVFIPTDPVPSLCYIRLHTVDANDLTCIQGAASSKLLLPVSTCSSCLYNKLVTCNLRHSVFVLSFSRQTPNLFVDALDLYLRSVWFESRSWRLVLMYVALLSSVPPDAVAVP